ncbi:MATE family efflux transporter [Erythrobacter sp. SDW2]|uniref:MATE family efflux transporter n=1 Tax=Erythrobacter sp. SDW2 TaxID=2907154 RepID=UPI001F30613A|nr:MATE family efflux transporter [Erythrobacter sp. SDW2]UIP06669.1 MATE family efflux transporter [Erythrobacter sp. SDW2]
MSENAKLTRGSIPGHLVSQTLPGIIGVAAMMSIGIVDAYYIGQLGSTELAAVSFIFPINVALASLGVGVMVGISSVVARALGEGDTAKAAQRANFGIAMAIAFGAVIGCALYAVHEPLFRLMNAGDEHLPLIEAYILPYALGFPLLVANMAMSGALRGQGEASRTSAINITYAVVNWVLNPILVTGTGNFEGFGIAGSAYATLTGWVVGMMVALRLMRGTLLPVDFSLLRETPPLDPLRSILRVAGPAALSNAINPIGLSVLTALVATESANAVAGFGAAARVQSFALVPLLALSGSIGGIVGQNWGAGQYDRARQAALYAGLFCIGWGLATATVLILAGSWLGQVFSDDPAVVGEFGRYLSIAAWGYAGFGVLIVGNGALNAIDRSSFALMQSCARVFLVMLPLAWFLRGSWGADAIYAAELAANLFGGIVASLVVWRLLRAPMAEPSLA